MKRLVYIFSACLFLFASCKEKTYYYEVNDIEILPNNSGKTKQKSVEQFINIAYANLNQKALSPDQLVDITDVIASIGDKQIAFETIIAKMITAPDVAIPPDSEMRADVPLFVVETYKRFYVRFPTEAEKTFWVNYINSHPTVTPETVYFAFATSDEYYYY
ncbi:MAG: hypothetical protein KDC34_11505 [Saprospiraceae bacterium]|nr:hypothetical protein [Saprospiraceae bacterium]